MSVCPAIYPGDGLPLFLYFLSVLFYQYHIFYVLDVCSSEFLFSKKKSLCGMRTRERRGRVADVFIITGSGFWESECRIYRTNSMKYNAYWLSWYNFLKYILNLNFGYTCYWKLRSGSGSNQSRSAGYSMLELSSFILMRTTGISEPSSSGYILSLAPAPSLQEVCEYYCYCLLQCCGSGAVCFWASWNWIRIH
jgi:hypothetical protein